MEHGAIGGVAEDQLTAEVGLGGAKLDRGGWQARPWCGLGCLGQGNSRAGQGSVWWGRTRVRAILGPHPPPSPVSVYLMTSSGERPGRPLSVDCLSRSLCRHVTTRA